MLVVVERTQTRDLRETKMKIQLLAMMLVGLVSVPAFAEDTPCTSNSDCAEGELCIALEVACPDGADCAPAEGSCFADGHQYQMSALLP